MFPFFEAAHKGQVCNFPLHNVMLWQVAYTARIMNSTAFHGGLLGSVLQEFRRVWSQQHSVPVDKEKVRIWFDEDIQTGDTFCFEEVIVVREPNAQHRKLALQTRASMSTAGVARGFGGDQEIRFSFRRAVLSYLRIPPPSARVPTITYLSRPYSRADVKLHGRSWQLRCHVTPGTFRRLRKSIYDQSYFALKRAIFEKTPYIYQAEVISQTDIFWSGHGAGMVHLPLLPKLAVAVEMFNCGHFSYLYANLAMNLGIKYFALQRGEPFCTTPALFGDTRKNMSKSYAYTYEEVMPTLTQAVRYHIWQDPSPELNGREPKCIVAQKLVAINGMLPPGMSRTKFEKECVPGFGNTARAEEHRFRSKFFAQKSEPPEGNGKPGQFTRWAGVG